MENENEFLKIARHQLKGPITQIKGYLSFWQNDDYQKFPPEKQKEFINKAMAGAEKLNVLINDVFLTLALDRKDDFKTNPEPIQLKEEIEAIYNEKYKADYEKKGLYFKIESQGEPLTINSDKHYLTIALQKLLDNAGKYTDAGGVTVFLEKENNYAIIIIKDTGVGLPPEDKEEVFDKFFHGSLSLFIIKGIINALGGEISAEEAGKTKGTKFILKLPL